jgi:cellulose synthase (UDP-forming)
MEEIGLDESIVLRPGGGDPADATATIEMPPAVAPSRAPDTTDTWLPRPPDDREKWSYLKRNRALLVRTSLVSFVCLLISQARFIETNLVLAAFVPFLFFTVAYYIISLFVNVGTPSFNTRAHIELVSEWRPTEWPSFDIFLPICREPVEVLRNTWSAVYELVQAYPGVATPYVLDDGADPAARELAASFGFVYGTRDNRGWFKKAGNLHYGFDISDGDFILILDADFAPRADLPMEMLPYFAKYPKLGIVQSPQFFRVGKDQSWMERGAGAVQELFYRMVQVSRDKHAGAICVGSCAVYRRAALADNGGTTLIEHSEDVHTGFDLRRHGWGLRYLPIPLATGLCPPDPDSFFTQQYRWCAGSMSLLGARKFWETKMRWRTLCCYLSGFCYYLHTALFTFVAPLIPLTMLLFLPNEVQLANYIFIIPSILYNLVVFPSWHRLRFGLTGFMAKLLYGWAHTYAIWDILRGRQMGWQTTGGKSRKSRTRRLWIGVWAWSGGTSLAWVSLALWRMSQYGVARFSVVFFVGAFTATVTAMAHASRRNYAAWERSRAV